MKKLMFATALVASAAAFANPLNAISFEGYSADSPIFVNGAEKTEAGDQADHNFFYFDGTENDGSLVKTFAGGDAGALPQGLTRTPAFAEATNDKYLELNTEGGVLWRSINNTDEGSLGSAADVAATGTYLDTLVQFTPTEDGGDPGLGQDDKLAIWLNVDANGVTNLMVQAGYYDGESTLGSTNFVLSGVQVVAGEWYRLTVKALPDILVANEEYRVPAFAIYINGTEMSAGCSTMDAGIVTEWVVGEILEAEMASKISSGSVFVSRVAGDPNANTTLQGVGFKGSGALDDIVWTNDNPFGGSGIDFTLTWPEGYAAVSYTVDGGTPVDISSESSPLAVPGLVGNEAIVFTFTNADGVTKTINATAADGEGINAAAAVYTWADYLGAAVSGAYEIDNLAELKLFQKGVAAGLATAEETFKLTADVALDAPWPGIGIQNGKDIWSQPAFDEGAFQGTFDGQNHTISGFQMVGVASNPKNNGEGLDYCGFFNSTYQATIQNLKIQYAGALFAVDTTASTKESGATFVGVPKGSTLVNLTSLQADANTDVSCSKGFGGIVGFLCGGSTVSYCTNNVNMTSLANNKCGGIAMITQGGSAVTIDHCVNNGTMTTGSSNSEYGGIVGYVALNTTIADCETTVGRFLSHGVAGTVTLQGVNKGDARVAGYYGRLTPGLNYATVDGTTATFVADNALAINGEYMVMAQTNELEVAFNFTEAGTITFDTNKAQRATFNVTASGLKLAESTSGSVVTFTASAYEYITVVELNTNALDLVVNDTYTLVATTTPASAADDSITWTSSDDTIATVVNGLVTAVAEGTATITAASTHDGTVKATCAVTVTKASSGWVVDPTQIEEGTTAADQYSALAGSALANADAKELTVWAKAKNVEFTDVTAAPANYVEAFLLNCAPTPAAVAEEKAEFELTITFDADGNPVVNLPVGKEYNGTLQLKGSTDLVNWADIDDDETGAYQFFKYELSL